MSLQELLKSNGNLIYFADAYGMAVEFWHSKAREPALMNTLSCQIYVGISEKGSGPKIRLCLIK